MKRLVPVLLSIFIVCTIFNFVLADEVPLYIDKDKTKIEPETIPITQTAKLTVAIANENETDLPCMLKVYGESLEVMPSTAQNITAYGSTYGVKITLFDFYIKANSSGNFPIKIELWYEGKQIDFSILYLKTFISYPVGIVKDSYKTKLNPSSIFVNQFSTLTVVVFNEEESDIFCKIKVYGQNITVFPGEEQNVTVYGKQKYETKRETSFIFYVKPNSVGVLPIKIELWFKGLQIDFHTLTLESKVPYQPSSQEIKATWIYVTSILTIISIYLITYIEDSETKNLALLFFLIFSFLFLITGVSSGEIYRFFSLILSQSFGKIEVMLAMAFILIFPSVIFVVRKDFNRALLFTNINIFLLALPIVIDWLYIPSFLMDTLAGRILWQVIQAIIAAIIGYIFDKLIKRKRIEKF